MSIIEEDELSEQERIAAICSMFAISRVVIDNQFQEIIDMASEVEVESLDISKITNLPIEVVNAALENLEDEGAVHIDDVQEFE